MPRACTSRVVSRWIFAASWGASSVGEMSHDEIRSILAVYAGAGLLAFLVLAVAARGRGV